MSLARFWTIRDSKLSLWVREHLDYPHKNWCLIWPFGCKGSGYPEVGSLHLLVPRLMCEYKNGPPPTPKHHAAHSCERGHDKCVNPNHLSWKTPTENQLDRFRGPAVAFRRDKLTPEQVNIIRQLKGVEVPHLTGKRFGVCESNVRLIQAGKIWRGDSHRRVLTMDEVLMVRAKPYIKSAKIFAAELGVTRSVIEKIRSGETYRYFYENADASQALPPADRGEA